MSVFGIQMLELLCTNTYSSKFVSFLGIHKYTNARIITYQGLFEQICIRRVFQHLLSRGRAYGKCSKNISFYNL